MCGCESWTIKKAEHQRIDAFELWCWRRLLRVPWTARRSNQSILKEINHWIFIGRTDVEAETPILWPPDVKNWLFWKDPDVGKDWGQVEKGMTEEMVGWHHWLWIWVWVSSGSWWWTGKLGVLQSPGSQRAGHDWATELNWTDGRDWLRGKLGLVLVHRAISKSLIQFSLDRWSCVPSLLFTWGQTMVEIMKIMAATAAAKSLQSCLTLCSPVPGILQARTLEWVAISFSNAWKWKVKVKSLSHVWLFTTPWTAT